MKTSSTRNTTRIQLLQKPIAFFDFWQDIANHVGDLELPLPDNPKRLEDITSQLDNYFNPLKQCLIDVYREHRCQHLQSLIKPLAVLDILGERSYQLKQDVVDVKDIDLLEDLGVYITRQYIVVDNTTHKTSRNTARNQQTDSAQIIRLDWYKTRKANLSQ